MKKIIRSWVGNGSGRRNSATPAFGSAAVVTDGCPPRDHFSRLQGCRNAGRSASNRKLTDAVSFVSAQIPVRLSVRSTLWNEFGLTVFESAELAGG